VNKTSLKDALSQDKVLSYKIFPDLTPETTAAELRIQREDHLQTKFKLK
jgi:hypothetical protein